MKNLKMILLLIVIVILGVENSDAQGVQIVSNDEQMNPGLQNTHANGTCQLVTWFIVTKKLGPTRYEMMGGEEVGHYRAYLDTTLSVIPHKGRLIGFHMKYLWDRVVHRDDGSHAIYQVWGECGNQNPAVAEVAEVK